MMFSTVGGFRSLMYASRSKPTDGCVVEIAWSGGISGQLAPAPVLVVAWLD
jgi:hypothetical protein